LVIVALLLLCRHPAGAVVNIHSAASLNSEAGIHSHAPFVNASPASMGPESRPLSPPPALSVHSKDVLGVVGNELKRKGELST
jgi:hypothetical protein